MIDQLVAIDRVLFALLNAKLTHPVLDSVMPFLTHQENWYPVLAGLWLAMIIWGGRRGRMAAVALVIAVALTDQISCSIIKPLVGRVRPCNALSPEQCRLLIGRSSATSFPSAHAANSFAMATVVSWRFKRFAPLLYFFAVAVAYSRVYVGVHYPLDSLAGAVLGALLGRLAIWMVVEGRRRWDRWWELRNMDTKRPRAAGA
jgi:undecaprenyl-diphosphatase